LKQLPPELNDDYQIYGMAKKLGITETQVKEEYTFAEIVERNAMDLHDNYVDRELMPKS
jgi:hypothetical protein